MLLTLGACAVRVTVVVLCVCVSVCYRASGYIPHFHVENKTPLGFLWRFQDMHCVAFVENALFKSSGDICWPPLPSSLLEELSIDIRDSGGFFSRRLVCRSSDRSYNLTDSSLVIVNCQLRFLPWTFFSCIILLIWHTRGTAAYYVIACNRH